jgi:poly(hydroxyalkanoate) depolymerase family esterase
MKIRMLPGMAQALHHLRAGHLKQAMAVLRQGFHAPAQERPATPEAPAADAAFQAHSYRNAAGARQYKLFVPSGFEGRELPLLVMLHGCTQSPDVFAVGTRMNAIAQEHGLLVAYPAQPQSANPNRCWNWFNALDQQRGRGEPSIIAGIVEDIATRHAIDRRRIFVAGMSAGGAMAATLATTYPDVFAAVGVHSGLPHGSARDVSSALAVMRNGATPRSTLELPAIVFHGDGDTVVSPRNAEAIAASWRAGTPAAMASEQSGEVNGRGYTRLVFRDDQQGRTLEHWIVHGAGHAWSGGSAAGSHTDPTGPDASREMVRFLLEHPKAS